MVIAWCPYGCGKKVIFKPNHSFFSNRKKISYKSIVAWQCQGCGRKFSRNKLEKLGLLKVKNQHYTPMSPRLRSKIKKLFDLSLKVEMQKRKQPLPEIQREWERIIS